MPRYVVHGLEVASNHAIPGLIPIEHFGPPDLTIWIGTLPDAVVAAERAGAAPDTGEPWFESTFRMPDGVPALAVRRVLGGAYARLTYADGIEFVVDRSAANLWVHWPPSSSLADVPSYLLGPVIGMVLRLQGILGLHGSAVEWQGHAIAFVGREGAGKSTLAAAFALGGRAVLSDDLVTVRPTAHEWMAAPGYPRVRLWPDSARECMRQANDAPLLPPGESGSTRRYHLDLSTGRCRFVEGPRPLGAIYLLEVSDDSSARFRAEPLSEARALMGLTGNTSGWRVVDRELRVREFEALTRLVADVPVRRLVRTRDIGMLDDYRRFIEDDLASLGLRDASALAHS